MTELDSTDARPDLRALTLDETQALAETLGLPKFRGEQAWRWVHGKGARS